MYFRDKAIVWKQDWENYSKINELFIENKVNPLFPEFVTVESDTIVSYNKINYSIICRGWSLN